jgi:putative transposase
MTELMLGLTEYFAFYNDERPHQSLGNRTPNDAHTSGNGGGASIPDRFGSARENTSRAATGQRCSAAIEETGTA